MSTAQSWVRKSSGVLILEACPFASRMTDNTAKSANRLNRTIRIVLIVDATTSPALDSMLPHRDAWEDHVNHGNGSALAPTSRTSRSKRYSDMWPCQRNQATRHARIRLGNESPLLPDLPWRTHPILGRCQILGYAMTEPSIGKTRKDQAT